ncbi:uncharacterized protein PAN0_031d6238 [Moesziomyces antarcticus]|uniref:Uncharacterized protein n=1 Tax=Pseudozyma antarctica TaxID=84753 RepID=A0A081CMW2_PSEA2|nr:uncharacterized protein PAN0_031d6238 [Moesziomyces antarcticus]GAK68008.1 hypothetical protein PAN0_031d6238 [Moesziomyces antarcticus]
MPTAPGSRQMLAQVSSAIKEPRLDNDMRARGRQQHSFRLARALHLDFVSSSPSACNRRDRLASFLSIHASALRWGMTNLGKVTASLSTTSGTVFSPWPSRRQRRAPSKTAGHCHAYRQACRRTPGLSSAAAG